MPYSNDPLNVPADAVRFLVGDTSTSPQLSDAEIDYLLADQSGVALRAAARAAEVIAAKYSSTGAKKKVGPLEIDYASRFGGSRASDYLALAKLLWAKSRRSVIPFAGGISRTDKAGRVTDTDRVPPAFRRRLHEYFTGSIVGGTSQEDLLSPTWPTESMP